MDEEDFRAFVAARWPALVRFAWTLTGDAGLAEDLVQTALERVWRQWRRVREESAEAYVRAAIVNLSVSRWRRRRVVEVQLGASFAGEDDVPPALLPVAADHAEQAAVHQAVWREVQALPPRMRAVVVLRFLEDFSEAATAELMGCSVATVKTQTARAMTRLRQRAGLRVLVAAPPAGGVAQPATTRPRS